MANNRRRVGGRAASTGLLRTEHAIELASKREDVLMKKAQRAALEQQVRERWVLLSVFVVSVLTSLIAAALGHPVFAAGGGLASLASGSASLVRRHS